MNGEVTLEGGVGPRLLLFGVLAFGLVMIYAPALYLLLASFNPSLKLGLVPPDDFSLVWYKSLLGDDRLLAALAESILVGLATGIVSAPIGFSAALAFRAMKARRGPFFLLILSAMFIPGTIEGLGLSVVFKVLAITPSWITVTAGHLLWALPFAFTVSLVSLAVVRPTMIAAARDLGATGWQTFRDVTLPLARNGLISSFVFAFLLSFNEYARAYYLVGRQNTLPLTMFGAMNSGASPAIYALSGSILIISFGLVGLFLIVGRPRLAFKKRAPKRSGKGLLRQSRD